VSFTNDGGPAFPVNPHPNIHGGSDGMSLRDWFAGQALAGIMPSDGRPDGDQAKAYWAYAMADAMLRAREGGAK